MISTKKGVQLIINFLVKAGLKSVVLSPGSRNAPLSLSFHHHSFFDTIVIPDERSAAYFALGISLHSQKPSVIVCTSGTAVLNYAPAIAEAYYQKVPMIVLTADRPAKWIDQGDGQTIRQENIFSNYILKSFSVEGDAKESDQLHVINQKLNEALSLAVGLKGPVHINVQLEEPLYHLEEASSDFSELIPIAVSKNSLSNEFKSELMNCWGSCKKIIILCGQQSKNAKIQKQLISLLEKQGVVVLTETTSNLVYEDFISCIDRTIDGFSNEDKENFKPDLLITIGEAVISKKIKSFFRAYKPLFHWNVNPTQAEMNTFDCLTHAVSLPTSEFLNELELWERKAEKSFSNLWISRFKRNQEFHEKFVSDCIFSDLKLFSVIHDRIPSRVNLHLGNSSAVRYELLFNPRKDLNYFSNRGVSGIDGSTSTAAGTAYSSGEQVTLISGDISFFYDSNALWNDYLKNLKVIVVNNGGGGIFRIIDRPKEVKDTEKLFETRHARSVKGIVEAFDVKYLSADNEESLILGLDKLYADNLPAVLEVFTPTELNAELLKEYFEFLKTK